MRTIGAFRPQLTQLLNPSCFRSFKVRALSSSSLPSSNQSRGGLPRFFSQVLPSYKAIPLFVLFVFFFFSITKFLYDWKLCMRWGCVSFGWGCRFEWIVINFFLFGLSGVLVTLNFGRQSVVIMSGVWFNPLNVSYGALCSWENLECFRYFVVGSWYLWTEPMRWIMAFTMMKLDGMGWDGWLFS